MSVTNNQIIAVECSLRGITEEVHTYAKWKQLGRQVKKGNRAMFTARIWKHTTKKDKETGEETQKMFMQNAAFFGYSQTEEIKKK